MVGSKVEPRQAVEVCLGLMWQRLVRAGEQRREAGDMLRIRGRPAISARGVVGRNLYTATEGGVRVGVTQGPESGRRVGHGRGVEAVSRTGRVVQGWRGGGNGYAAGAWRALVGVEGDRFGPLGSPRGTQGRQAGRRGGIDVGGGAGGRGRRQAAGGRRRLG